MDGEVRGECRLGGRTGQDGDGEAGIAGEGVEDFGTEVAASADEENFCERGVGCHLEAGTEQLGRL